jgi:hypothetical protein
MSHIWSLKRNFLKTSAIAGATFAGALVVPAALASANEPRAAVFQFTLPLQRDAEHAGPMVPGQGEKRELVPRRAERRLLVKSLILIERILTFQLCSVLTF